MKIFIVISIFFIFSNYCLAFIDFNGYINNLASIQKTPETVTLSKPDFDKKYFSMNLTRLRLRPSIDLSDNARITMHYEANLIWSELDLMMLSNLGKTNRQAVNLSKEFYDKSNLRARHFIDMLYYKHIFDKAEFTIGRQVVAWGTGRVWQPTDMFNPLNPANFTKIERDGIDAISGKYYLGNFSDIEIVANFREDMKKNNYGARFRTNLKQYDLAIMGGYFDENPVLGANFAGDLFDAGFRGEALFSHNQNNPDSSFIKAILGLDYQFSSELYGLVEYHYNGEGTDCRFCYDLERLARGEIQNVGKHYFTSLATYLVTPLFNTSTSALVNIYDGSGYLNLQGTYSIKQDINLSLSGMLFWGSKYSEYWYYAPAVFLTVDFYF